MQYHYAPAHNNFMTIRNIFRWLAYLLTFIMVILAIAVLTIRFYVFPHIDQYKHEIATYAGKTLQRKVTIGNIRTGWHHISPRVTLDNIEIYDEQNRPALTLQRVDTELSWLSLGLLDLRLSELTAHAPTLIIRRSKQGIFYLAGVNLSGRGNPDFANWILAQSKVSIINANITYLDELRQAPPLALQKLNLTLSNSAWKSILGKHEFNVETYASIGSKDPIQLDGYFIGRDMSNLKDWHGSLHLTLKNTDLSVWHDWIDYPLEIRSGTGNAQASLHFSALAIDELETDIKLRQLSVAHAPSHSPLYVNQLQGRLGWKKTKYSETVSVKDINVSFDTGLAVEAANGEWEHSSKKNQPWIDAYFSVQTLHLNKIAETARYLKLPPQWMEWIEGLSPKGKLTSLKAAVSGHPDALQNYALSGNFNQLSLEAYRQMPGVSNMSGTIDMNERTGEIELNTRSAALDLKDILRWPVPISSMQGAVKWQTNAKGTTIFADQLAVKNPHIGGTIRAKFEHKKEGDFLDLHAKFDNGNAKFAPFYYPIILGKETLHWLDTSILAGQANNVNVIVKGKLTDFPFVNAKNQPDPALGQFKVTAQIQDAQIEYGTGWPLIKNLNTEMLFEGKRMFLNAKKGEVFGNKIISSKVEIAQLDADWPMLRIVSVVEGPIKEGIRFVNESPVREVAMGFTDSLKTAGDGHLDLDLMIPMQDLEAAKYKGAYLIKNGTLFANDEVGLPELAKINGTLAFTESGLSATNVSTEILGGPARINLSTGAEKSLRINASGRISDTGIKKVFSHPLVNTLQGSTDWKGDIAIKKPLANFTFTSNLVGMSVNLPAPLAKSAEQISTLRIEKTQSNADNDEIALQYGELISAKIARNMQEGKLTIDRGEIGFNTMAVIPTTKGMTLKAKLDNFDADEWLTFFNQNTPGEARNNNSGLPAWLNQADVTANTLNVLNRDIHQLKANLKPVTGGVKMSIQSQELTGDVIWQNEGNGKIIAKLKNLAIPNAAKKEDPVAKREIKRVAKQYPALDLDVDNFEIGDKKLGALTVDAFENGDDWVIQKLNISNSDFTLAADGSWHNWTRNPNTNFKFTLQSDSIGRSLKRFGQPDAVKGGKATLSGQLRWPGSPHEFETTSLNGNLKLEAEKGQIVKVQPGVGRLLGLLSLQSLPRRLSLDFRDLFSEGFAFDRISATATANGGILKSNDFYMTGPAAEAKIQGETNLKTETQNLKVSVIPHVSDSLSLAALAGGPIVGAAAFVAQKILKDPFNKIASTEYVITGTWDNPQELESKQNNAPKPENKLR